MKTLMKRAVLLSLPLLMAGCDDKTQAANEIPAQSEESITAPRIAEPTLGKGSLTGDDLAAFAPEAIQKWVLSLPAGEYKLNLHADVTDPTGNGIGGSIDCKMLERMTFPVEEAETISFVIKFPGPGNPMATLLLYSDSSAMKIPLGKAFSAALVPEKGEKPGLLSQMIEAGESNGRIQNFKLGEISFERAAVSADGKPLRREVVLKLDARRIEPAVTAPIDSSPKPSPANATEEIQ